ncbi:hypothetical protein B0H16DRAFT_657783 [Mycena metata]|uniref:Uncharacterized protein n=1 Tax=Mycena metata TaxID=1033252 RepID=A0AAD7J7S4_9AGAR|nr:hypothetical protein B0H16DRAFT_657783 [Mycena metata]
MRRRASTSFASLDSRSFISLQHSGVTIMVYRTPSGTRRGVLRKGLETLPSCSPLLQSLSMKFKIKEPANSPFTMDPDLAAGLTRLRLPALTSLEFSFYAEEYFQLPNPAVNFVLLLMSEKTQMGWNGIGQHETLAGLGSACKPRRGGMELV